MSSDISLAGCDQWWEGENEGGAECPSPAHCLVFTVPDADVTCHWSSSGAVELAPAVNDI